MGQQEIEAYLNHLANKRIVSASTQSAALTAIAFLYRAVLTMDMPCLQNLRRIKRHQAIPVVMSVREIEAIGNKSLRQQRGKTLVAELGRVQPEVGCCNTLGVDDS